MGNPLADCDSSPLLVSPAHLETTSQEGQDILDHIDAAARRLRSNDDELAPKQNEEFYTFIHTLVESYNDNPARIQGLENALNPLIVLDPPTQIYEVNRDQLTNYNTRVINTLMHEHSRSKHSILTMANATLKTIFKRVTRNTK